jgi:hypothetical protein
MHPSKGQDSSLSQKRSKSLYPIVQHITAHILTGNKIILCCTCTCTTYIVTNFWTQSRKVACLSLLHLLEKQRSSFQVTVPVIFSSLHMWRQLVKNFSYIVTDFLLHLSLPVLNRENRERRWMFFLSVLRIRDVYPVSRIRIFSIPDPGSKRLRIPDPDPHQRI